MSERIDALTGEIRGKLNVVARIFTGIKIPGFRGHVETSQSYYCFKHGKAINVRDRRAKRLHVAQHEAGT